jgi:hypothetical protein
VFDTAVAQNKNSPIVAIGAKNIFDVIGYDLLDSGQLHRPRLDYA